MNQIHLLCGALSNIEIREIRDLALGKIPKGWQKVATGSQASVFSSQQYFLKIFPRETWGQKFKLLFKTKSLHAHDCGSLVVQKEQRMAALGFFTATVLAHGRVCDKTILLTRRIPGMTLHDALLRTKGKSKFTLTQKLAEQIAKMHSRGIYHGDLNANNIMVTGKNGEFRFYFLDNEKNKFYGKTPHKKATKNLSQLNYLIIPEIISKSDRLRFLITYLASRDMLEEKTHWWKIILALFNRRQKRKNDGAAKSHGLSV